MFVASWPRPWVDSRSPPVRLSPPPCWPVLKMRRTITSRCSSGMASNRWWGPTLSRAWHLSRLPRFRRSPSSFIAAYLPTLRVVNASWVWRPSRPILLCVSACWKASLQAFDRVGRSRLPRNGPLRRRLCVRRPLRSFSPWSMNSTPLREMRPVAIISVTSCPPPRHLRRHANGPCPCYFSPATVPPLRCCMLASRILPSAARCAVRSSKPSQP